MYSCYYMTTSSIWTRAVSFEKLLFVSMSIIKLCFAIFHVSLAPAICLIIGSYHGSVGNFWIETFSSSAIPYLFLPPLCNIGIRPPHKLTRLSWKEKATAQLSLHSPPSSPPLETKGAVKLPLSPAGGIGRGAELLEELGPSPRHLGVS